MFKPLLLLFKVTGLWPSGSRLDRYLSATSFTLALLMSALSYRQCISMYLYNLQSIVFVVVSPFVFLSFLSCIVQAHFCKQAFLSISEGLTLTDSSQASLYLSEVFQFSFLLVFVLSKVFEFYQAFHSFYLVFVLSLTSYFALVTSLLHVVIVRQLGEKFSELNERLKAVAGTSQTASLTRLRADLRELLREHALLRRLVKHINSYFAFYSLCSFFASLVFLVLDVYSLLLHVRNHPTVSMSLMFAILQTGFLFVYKLDVCHRCSDKANEAVMIAHRMVQPNSPAELMDDVELFSLAQFKNPVALTAAGVFNMNRGLITKAGAASLSYLIVAVQLRPVG